MKAVRWLALPFCASLTALVFAACNAEVSTGSSAAGSGGGGGTATSGDVTSGISSTGSSMPEAGPLTCKGSSVSDIPPGECDLLTQDCVLGYTCNPASVGPVYTTKCIPVSGIKSEGEVCYSPSECRGGLHCIANRCAPFCCPTTGEPCKGGFCGFTVEYAKGAYKVHACRYSQQCQVLTPDACPSGYDCHVDIDNDHTGLATCGQPSPNPVGEYDPCTYTNDCGNMQACVDVGSGKHCYTLCWVKPPNPNAPKGLGTCAGAEQCKFYADFGIDNLGTCL